MDNGEQDVDIRDDTWGSRKLECQRQILLLFTIMPWTGASATPEIAFIGFLDFQTLDLALASPSLLYPLDQGGTWAAYVYTWEWVSESTKNKQPLPWHQSSLWFYL